MFFCYNVNIPDVVKLDNETPELHIELTKFCIKNTTITMFYNTYVL